MNCPSCNFNIETEANFCPSCGHELGKNCPNCSSKNKNDALFCKDCGTKLKKVHKTKTTPQAAKQAGKPLNSFALIAAAAFFALVIVILILRSNLPDTETASTNSPATVNPPAQTMQIMQQINELKNRLSEAPDNAHLNIEMGNNLFDIQRYDEAIPYYRNALKVEPDNIAVQIDLAVSLYNTQQVEEAITEMKKALQLNPQHTKGLFNIGVMYYNQGKMKEAESYWTKLITLHDNTREAETAKQLLKNIKS